MSTGAWVMLVVGATLFWGGTAFFVYLAAKGKGFN